MKKLLKLLDDNLLRFGVAFAILFTALYPKLPSINVPRTWVYIRLEDFVILALAIIWVIMLLRRKVSFPKPEGYALIGYWIMGLLSLLYCFAFVVPTLGEFFPEVAALQYARRIEYMILFLIAFSTIKNVKDVYFYLVTLCITVLGVVLYGFGQRFYFILWAAFPDFFKANPFCFPAFLTGNEEFAKGIPLCLNDISRITSTFGGHYDLSAYLVMVIPILLALIFAVKRWTFKILLLVLALCSLELLNFTSSRVSFGAYIFAVTGMLILWQKKKWIVPVLAVSVCVMLLFGNSTISRFAKTIQPVQVVSVEEQLPDDLKKIISDAKEVEAGKKPATPPPGTVTVGTNTAAPSGGFTTVLTESELTNLQNGDISISSVSGSFLIQKAYALDISFTTRFQAEWPRNWNAFISSPVFGTGYSTLTLATDNDYLRALGETGLAGLLSFLLIFVILGILMKESLKSIKDPIIIAFMYGLAGGIIGLLVNAIMIDVFEASKVAEPMWLLLGIAAGAAKLLHKPKVNYKEQLWSFLSSRTMIVVYMFILIIWAYIYSISNFFVADDFSWLKWAASSKLEDLPMYFISSQDFFYRPLDKVITYFLYMLFSFHPQGYHIFMLFLHFVATSLVYFLGRRLTHNNLVAFLAAALFAVHPVHTENIFWFSTISINLFTVFGLAAVLAYIRFRDKKSIVSYILAILFTALGFVSYEQAVILPLLFILIDLLITRQKWTKKTALVYIPFFILLALYILVRTTSGAFAGGGDYSYNLTKVIPNFIGNLIGYKGMFMFGTPFLSFYDVLRADMRSLWLSLSLVMAIIVSVIVWAIFTYKKLIAKALKEESVRGMLFGILFGFVTLLPFLALGNVAPRYMYMASAGYCIAFVVLVYYALVFIRSKKHKAIALFVLIALLAGYYFVQSRQEEIKWRNAGSVSKATLTFFRTEHSNFPPDAQLYFINTPVKMDGVWVFPVGLKDGLWFIYREDLPNIHQVGSLDEVRTMMQSHIQSPPYIFIFDKNGTITQVTQY